MMMETTAVAVEHRSEDSEPAWAPGLARCWFPVAWSRDLGTKRPFGFTVLGRRFVAFRAHDEIVVLEDRCPHRGVRLSGGRIRSGAVECPYHGWRFGPGGRCVLVPSKVGQRALEAARAESFPAREIDGMVWFCPHQEPEGEPTPWHYPEDRGFLTTIDLECSYVRLLANLVDNPHAGFLHAGLLRGEPSKTVRAEITESSAGVLIRTSGEVAQGALLYRLFGRANQPLEHLEEFIAPNVIRTTFAHRPLNTVASSQFVCTPVDEHRTRVHYRVTLRVPGLGSMLAPLFAAVVRKIIRQDRFMLEEEERCAAGDPRRWVSTESDVPSIRVTKRAREFAGARASRVPPKQPIRVEYRL